MKRHIGIIMAIGSLLLVSLLVSCSSGSDSKIDEDGDLTDGDDVLDGDEDGDLSDGDTLDGDEESPDPSEAVQRGIQWLEEGEAVFANEAFQEAFVMDPSNKQARFGYAFSEALISFELIEGVILGAATGVGDMLKKSGKAEDGEPPEGYESWDAWFQELLVGTLDLISQGFHKSVELYGPLKEEGGLSITFEKLPIYMGLEKPTYIRGEIDDADVFFLDAMSRLLAFVFDYLVAHQFQSDLGSAISGITVQFGDDLGLPQVLNIVAYLLNYDTRFLAFSETGKADVMEDKQLLLGALQDLVQGAAALEDEAEVDRDQSDEFFILLESDGKNAAMQIHVWDEGHQEEEMQQVIILGPEEMVASATWATQITEGGDPVPMKTVVLPVVASMAMLPVGFGMLKYVGFDIGMDADILTPSVLVSLIGAFVRFDKFALDLHAFYEDPKSLRELLPAWTTDRASLENTLLMEWECSQTEMADGIPDGASGMMCADTDALEDGAHFVGTGYEIGADGIPLPTPYLAFQDPSFGQMLYIDVPALDLEGYPEEPQWQVADQTTANVAIGEQLAKLLVRFASDK